MVFMANGIARGRVRTTATATESRKMVAILLIGGDMLPWFIVYFFDFGHPCQGQFTPVNTRYPLKLELIEVTFFFFKSSADQLEAGLSIANSYQANLLSLPSCLEAG